ncbi:MAG: aminomethyl-transferring glycine dehydrogenase subunit GcvPA [Myxococcota bacterium]
MRDSHGVRYIPHTDEDVRRMLQVVGVPDVEALFACIPDKLRLDRPLELPAAASEQEIFAELSQLAARNADAQSLGWFLGAGTYAHFIPSAVDALVSRAEFTTSYTPYQPEISQGTLQAIFEWQTMICGLTGLEVTNASLYDGASATAEAALMAMRLTRRSRVVVASGLHPHYRDVLATYLGGLSCEIVAGEREADGRAAPVAPLLDDDTACVIVQQPSFLGPVQDLQRIAQETHASGALLVVGVTEALSLGLLQAPGDLGADLVCGEAQSFGVPMGLGGPHLGFLAAREKFARQMPGRLVGETVDANGKRGFVLTLSTREQHIRRERATSNICTNQGLCLLMATVYLALMGPHGLARLARSNLARARYAQARVAEAHGLSLPLSAPGFNEFVVGVPDSAADALERAVAEGLVGGLDLSAYAPELGPAVLVCTTELADRGTIDRLVTALAGSSL